jgi:hypothetical protein
MENLGALDFSENIQSSRVFYADSRDTVKQKVWEGRKMSAALP